MLKAYKINFNQRMLIHTKCSRQFHPYAYELELPKKIKGIKVLTLCYNLEDITSNGGPNAQFLSVSQSKEEIEDVIDHQIVQLDEGFIRSILSNGTRSHFQIAYGSHIRNLTLKSCLQLIRVNLSLGELMETSGNHL